MDQCRKRERSTSLPSGDLTRVQEPRNQPAHHPESTAGDPGGGGGGVLLVAGFPCTGPTYHRRGRRRRRPPPPAGVLLQLPTRIYSALLQIEGALPTRMSPHSRCNHSHPRKQAQTFSPHLPLHLGLPPSSPGSPASEAPLCVPPQPTHISTQGPVCPASGGAPPETPCRYPYLRPWAASASGAGSVAASC